MNYEFTGILTEKKDTLQVSDKFKKREFILEKTETFGQTEFTDYIKFELTQDKCNLIDGINIGQEITVHFNLRGNKWVRDGKTNYFTNLQVWKIGDQKNTETPPLPNIEDAPEESDDLPF